MSNHTSLQGHVDPLLHPHSSSTSIFGILGSHFESVHFLHYLIGCHEVIVMPTLETFQICGLKWHKSTDILTLDPCIINMRGTMIPESGGYFLDPPIHVLVVLSIQHIKTFSFIAQSIISIPSHTFISDEELGESIPGFLSCTKILNVWHIFVTHTKLYHV